MDTLHFVGVCEYDKDRESVPECFGIENKDAFEAIQHILEKNDGKSTVEALGEAMKNCELTMPVLMTLAVGGLATVIRDMGMNKARKAAMNALRELMEGDDDE